MIQHYIKIAFRNLWKYKVQSFISIIGLAVGFACFAISLFWIQYEQSFDNFHPNADRIYRVRIVDKNAEKGFSSITPYPLSGYLKKTFPEIKEACSLNTNGLPLTIEGTKKYHKALRIDSSFVRVFNVSQPIPFSYLPPYSSEKERIQLEKFAPNEVAITRKAARSFFGSEDVIGRKLSRETLDERYTVRYVIDDWPENSNIPFEIILPDQGDTYWNASSCHTYILLNSGIDAKAFKQKIEAHVIKTGGVEGISLSYEMRLLLTPIRSIHYESPDGGSGNIKYIHVQLFALLGLLVMLCALFNYLVLMVSRIKTRGKELALRRINGSSSGGLFLLLNMEVLLTMLIGILVGIAVVYITFPYFKELAGLAVVDLQTVYLKISKYAAMVVMSASLIAAFPILYFRRRTLQETIRGINPGRNKLFSSVGIWLQLAISIGFIFCTSCMIKQINHLSQVDLGFNRNRVCYFNLHSTNKVESILFADLIRQLPSVEDVLKLTYTFLPSTTSSTYDVKGPDGKIVRLNIMMIHPQFMDFFDIKLLRGNTITEDTPEKDVIINETAFKLLAENDSLENILDWKVIGVVKDIQIDSPTAEIKPFAFVPNKEVYQLAYRYKEHTREETEAAIRRLVQKVDPKGEAIFTYMEDTYNDFFKSENALLSLLKILSGVCLLISMFGIYSVVTLACEQRRKEIAIRKINGASVATILKLFFKEYLLILALASIAVFPVGYMIMKRWIEQYIKQTSIDWWVYVSIFTGLALIIAATVFLRIWKAANQNPAEVVKSE